MRKPVLWWREGDEHLSRNSDPYLFFGRFRCRACFILRSHILLIDFLVIHPSFFSISDEIDEYMIFEWIDSNSLYAKNDG